MSKSTGLLRMSSVGSGQASRLVPAILVVFAAIVEARPVNANTTKPLQIFPTVPADLEDRSSNLPIGGRNDPRFATATLMDNR